MGKLFKSVNADENLITGITWYVNFSIVAYIFIKCHFVVPPNFIDNLRIKLLFIFSKRLNLNPFYHTASHKKT